MFTQSREIVSILIVQCKKKYYTYNVYHTQVEKYVNFINTQSNIKLLKSKLMCIWRRLHFYYPIESKAIDMIELYDIYTYIGLCFFTPNVICVP